MNDNEYFAGPKITIADISILANVASFEYFNLDLTAYPKLSAWYKKMQSFPGSDENKSGAIELGDLIKGKLGGRTFF